MLFSVLTRKRSLKPQLSPSNIPVLVKRNQISVSSSFRAKFPHSLQVSFLTEPGTQPNRSSVSSDRPNGEISSQRLRPRKMATASRLQRQGWGRGHRSSRPGPRLVEGLREGAESLKDVVPSLFPGTSSSSTSPRLGDLRALQKNA